MIPFNKPFMTGNELKYIEDAHRNNQLAGNGIFTEKCQRWLKKHTGSNKTLLTHSCTAALEISALLLCVQPGDEIIMPSFTFVSTANAFALRGAKIVFVDIRPDTLNIDENKIEQAISTNTKAIVVVHYAGVGCEMDSILSIGKKYNIPIVEDAAQAISSYYKGKPLGGIGDIGCFSFHETKNIIAGEGGALLINNSIYSETAEIHWEKGTDRSKFFRGEVDKYTWNNLGSSYLPGEIIAAFLWAQLQAEEKITASRIKSWNVYHELLHDAEQKGVLTRPTIPESCLHNAHIYYILLSKHKNRSNVLKELHLNNINAVFHYVPLHQAPFAEQYCKISDPLNVTNDVSDRLIRLPLWVNISISEQERVSEKIISIIR